jgi:hypothetical protein
MRTPIRCSGRNGNDWLAEQFGMLGAIPRISSVLALFRRDRTVCTTVAFVLDLLVAALGAIDRIGLNAALPRAENVAIPVIDNCTLIEVDIARIVVCSAMASAAFGSAVPIGAVDRLAITHDC